MPKLVFKYGTMNSSKTSNLLMLAHTYRSHNKKVLLLKPETDIRDGFDVISSRIIPLVKADIILSKTESDFSHVDTTNLYCILVDEAQFLSEQNINGLRKLSLKVPVLCYGLRTDYRSVLFEGSKRLMEIADTIEEIKSVCVICDKKAIINAKFYTDGDTKTIIYDGDSSPDLGAEDKYQPLCWNCWRKHD